MMTQEYVRFIKTTTGFGKIIPKEDVTKSIKDPNAAWYKSLFSYGNEMLDYVSKNNGSTEGYKGPAHTDRLVWDLDNKQDITKAQADAITLLGKLEKEGVNISKNVQVYFSGNKGFHVELLTNRKFTPEESKVYCTNVAKDLSSFDPKIYNATRLFRIVSTKHQDSGLFKIELDPGELCEMTMDQIKDLAKNPRDLAFTPEPFNSDDLCNKFKTETKVHKSVSVIVDDDSTLGIRGISDINFHKCPKYMPRCIYALTHGIMLPGVGERNELFLRLATYYRNQGNPQDVTYNILKGIARLNSQLYPESEAYNKDELWNTVIKSAYSEKSISEISIGGYGTSQDNPTLRKYCDCLKHTRPCILHAKGDKKEIIKISDVSSSFEVFAGDIDNNTIKTGIDFIDSKMRILTGTPNLIVGATGCGKTTLALNMIENCNKRGLSTAFFSLDMNKNMIYLKLAQKHTNYSQDQILEFYKTRNRPKIEEIRNAINAAYGKTHFDFTTSQSLIEIEQRIYDIEEKTGEKIKLVAIDYASRLVGPYSDAYSNGRFNALKSVEVADNTNTALLILCQVSRANSDGSTPLMTKRVAKDSGDWEESARTQINVWRNFLGRQDQDKIMNVYLAKNTLGQEIPGVLHWNGAKGEIRDLTEQEIMEYETELKPLEEASSGGRKMFND